MNALSLLLDFLPFAAFAAAIGIFYAFRAKVKKAWAIQAALAAACAAGFILTRQPGPAVALLNLAGAAGFALLYFRYEKTRLGASRGQLSAQEAEQAREQKRVAELKGEWEKSEKEIVRSLRLYGTLKGLGEALAWDEMVPHIDYAVQQCLGFKEYQLYLKDDTQKLQKMISRGFRLLEPPLNDLAQEPKLHPKTNEAYLEVPIRHGEESIALLWGRISSVPIAPKSAASMELVIFSKELAEGLGVGLQKARLFSSLEKLSRIDGLTGVYRRQIFNDRLDEEIRRAQAFGTGFSILLADLDHFKHVNDTHGHQAGDEVLRRVGQIFKEGVYETDFVARYGGEEFVILFPQADPAGVLRKAEALRQRIERETIALGWTTLNITASMGISHFPKDGSDPNTLLGRADKALYAAKEGGRNRIVDSQ